jgi:hypothetical protein
MRKPPDRPFSQKAYGVRKRRRNFSVKEKLLLAVPGSLKAFVKTI